MARRVQTEGQNYMPKNAKDESDDYGAEDAAPEKDENGNLMNYKGIYFNDDPNTKYTDPITGAHFEFKDMIKRLNKVLQKRQVYENQIAALQQMPKQLLQDMEMGNGAPAGAGGQNQKGQLQREKEELKRKIASRQQMNESGVAMKQSGVTQAQGTSNAGGHTMKTRASGSGANAANAARNNYQNNASNVQNISSQERISQKKNRQGQSFSYNQQLQPAQQQPTQHLVAQIIPSGSGGSSVQNNNNSSAGQKENSILTRYQQQQLQLLEKQSNILQSQNGTQAQWRSKSNDKNAGTGIGGSGSYGGGGEMISQSHIPGALQNSQGHRLSAIAQKKGVVGRQGALLNTNVTAEDSRSPQKGLRNQVVPNKVLGQTAAALRSDSSKRRKTPDDLNRVRHSNGGGAQTGMGTNKSRQNNGVNHDNNLTGLYSGDFTGSKSNQRRSGTHENMPNNGLANGQQNAQTMNQHSYHQSINSNRNLRTRSSQRSNRVLRGADQNKGMKQDQINSGHKGIANTAGAYQHPIRQGAQGVGIAASRNHGLDKQGGTQTFYGKQIAYKSHSIKKQVGSQGGQISNLVGSKMNTTHGGGQMHHRAGFSGITNSQIAQQQQQQTKLGQPSGGKSRNGPSVNGVNSLRIGNSLNGKPPGSVGSAAGKSPGMSKSLGGQAGYQLVQQHLGEVPQRVKNTNSSMTGHPTYMDPNMNHTLQSQGLRGVNINQGGQPQGSQKDNQNLYKMMYHNSRQAPQQQSAQKNLASNYLRGIDNQLRGSGISRGMPNNNSTKAATSGIQVGNNVLGGVGQGSSRNKNVKLPSSTQKTRSVGNNKMLADSVDFRKSYY